MIVVVAKRLVRFTKIRFFNFSEQKIEFLFCSMVGYLVWHIFFSFNSNLTIFVRKCTEKSSQTGFWACFCFVFSTLTIPNLLFRGLFNIYRRSVGLIGFLEGLSIDFCFQHFELRVWRTDIYCSNLQLAIETIKFDIKKYRGFPAY